MALRLYDYVLSGSAYKARLLMAILGVPYEAVPVDFYPGNEHRQPDFLDLNPMLDLDMRLGEGSGAMAAVPLIAMACAGITDVPTFGEWFGE